MKKAVLQVALDILELGNGHCRSHRNPLMVVQTGS